MTKTLRITYQQGTKAQVNVPASKSISNRLLILNAVSGNKLNIENLSTAEDTLLLKSILDSFMQKPDKVQQFNCKNAGTVIRFLTAFFSFREAEITLTGDQAMKHRPIAHLVEALRLAGAKISYLEKQGFPPLKIKGNKPKTTIKTEVDGSQSSQFISAILLNGTIQGLDLQIKNFDVSRPFVNMTMKLMKQIGIKADFHVNRIQIPKQDIKSHRITSEQDWSSAAPWYMVAAFDDSIELNIPVLRKDSIQGDRKLCEIYQHFGVGSFYNSKGVYLKKTFSCEDEIHLNTADFPDTVPYLICSAAGTANNITIEGISHLRFKESDRIAALQHELQKLNNQIELIDENKICLKGKGLSRNKDYVLDAHDDHRLAMAFAPLAIKCRSITINGADSISKSYPGFWEELAKCGFKISE